MKHRQGVWLMVLCTLMWSIAGVVTRWLHSARGFEITFWRAVFCALTLVVLLGWLRGPAALWRTLRNGPFATLNKNTVISSWAISSPAWARLKIASPVKSLPVRAL